MTTTATDAASALQRLEAVIRGMDGVLIAFSGGVDSGVLLAVAAGVLSDRVTAVIADSPSLPRQELAEAIRFAERIGVRLFVEQTSEMELDSYRRNDTSRCYWCKQTLFDVCERVAAREGMGTVAYGYTVDDAGDFRPGHRAALEHGVRAPLFEASLGKTEIRAIARVLGLQLSEKPAGPCLSSRIPYGSEVTLEKLQHIESMESLLHELGFSVCRARFDGQDMRIEVEVDEITRAVSEGVREQLLERAKTMGVRYLSIDIEGFRSGKLNRGIARP